MKISTNGLMIAAVLATSNLVCLAADNQIPDPSAVKKEIYLKKDRPTVPSRPRVPSNQIIHMVYNMETQECLFELPRGIEFITVEVIDVTTGFTFYGEVYASDPICNISMDNGNYTIICTAEDGSIFSGYLYL